MEKENKVAIEYLNTITQIQLRFSTTLVMSRIRNDGEKDEEVKFAVILPEPAFISKFVMVINGKTIIGNVKEKEYAKVKYEIAKSRGESAGHVAQNVRETNKFEVSVNVAAKSKVVFNLTYQEMLKRVHGVYKNILNLQPHQPVENMQIDVYINERGEIKNIHVPSFAPKAGEIPNRKLLEMEDEKNCIINKSTAQNSSNVHISFKPPSCKGELVSGQFVVLYDVDRSKLPFEITLVNGYFVHFAAPEGLQVGSKHVVFALDVSGSMNSGLKLCQLQDAMDIMLSDLSSADKFNILLFSSHIKVWMDSLIDASAENIKKAQTFIQNLRADLSTDLNNAFLRSLQCLNSDHSNALSSMVVLLTDGQPTTGECNENSILANINEANRKGFPIHCLGFGKDVNYSLIKSVSSEHKGLARKIYEDSDASLQITGFFDEIRSPVLTEVKMTYLNDTVDLQSLVQDEKIDYYVGGELMVIGRLKDVTPNIELNIKLNAKGVTGDLNLSLCATDPADNSYFVNPPNQLSGSDGILPSSLVGGFIERMWAYQSIKKYLKLCDELVTDGQDKKSLNQTALDLCLKYQFVTKLTSMVVTDDTQTIPVQFDRNLDQFKKPGNLVNIVITRTVQRKQSARAVMEKGISEPRVASRGLHSIKGLGGFSSRSFSDSDSSTTITMPDETIFWACASGSNDSDCDGLHSIKRNAALTKGSIEHYTRFSGSRGSGLGSFKLLKKRPRAQPGTTDKNTIVTEQSEVVSKKFVTDIAFVVCTNGGKSVHEDHASLIRKIIDQFSLFTSKTILMAIILLGDVSDGKSHVAQPFTNAFSNSAILKNATRNVVDNFDANLVSTVVNLWSSGLDEPNSKIVVFLADVQSLKNVEHMVKEISDKCRDLKMFAATDSQYSNLVSEKYFEEIFVSPTAADLCAAILM